MKILYKYLLVTTLSAGIVFSGQNSIAESNASFDIKDIKVHIYDNQKDTLVEKPTNQYGNGMDIFLSVIISQNPQNNAESFATYSITVEGYGKGRKNPAEGLVEDYRVKETKEVTIYNRNGQYIPFILKYPCTEKATYTITVVQKGTNNTATKTIQSPHAFCILY